LRRDSDAAESGRRKQLKEENTDPSDSKTGRGQPTQSEPGLEGNAPERRLGWPHWVAVFGLLALVVAGGLALWHGGIIQRLSSQDELVAWLREAGYRGPLLCIAIQFIQVVIFVIPGEITQFASGYVFGAWRGLLYSIVGIMLGSAFNFYFARFAGRPTLERLISRATLRKVDRLLNSARGKSAVFILFLIPGTPKDAMCYGAGFSNLGLTEFIVISGLARLPALLSSTLLGSQASKRDYRAMAITGVVAGAAIAAYYLYERFRGKSEDEANGGGEG
jgi:uncharacterized membrane protein YdjX (TVP38/TMEM64 family)